MRCYNQPLTSQIPEMQPPQQVELPGAPWPTFPPQVVFNPWMAPPYYHAMSPLSPQAPPLPQLPLPAPQEQPAWFQPLVAAISKEVRDNATKPITREVDRRMAAPVDLSAEDERILIKALKRQRESKLTMHEVFEELIRNSGHTEADWKTLFIDNYERLQSVAIAGANIGHRSEGSSSRPLQFATALVSDLTQSRRTSKPMQEKLSGDSRRRSIAHRRSDGLACRAEPQRQATTNGKTKKAPTRTRVRSRAGELPVPITPADLRAMAQYRFEKGDDAEIRRYCFAWWREFAARPENRKRTLAGWTCIPQLHARHAAAIDRYVEEFKKEAEAAKSKMPKLEESSATARENTGDPKNMSVAMIKARTNTRKKTPSAVEHGADWTVETRE